MSSYACYNVSITSDGGARVLKETSGFWGNRKLSFFTIIFAFVVKYILDKNPFGSICVRAFYSVYPSTTNNVTACQLREQYDVLTTFTANCYNER